MTPEQLAKTIFPENKNTKREINIKLPSGFLWFLLGVMALQAYAKIEGHLDWSWTWVTWPAWMPFAVPLGVAAAVLAIGVAVAVVAGIVLFVEWMADKVRGC